MSLSGARFYPLFWFISAHPAHEARLLLYWSAVQSRTPKEPLMLRASIGAILALAFVIGGVAPAVAEPIAVRYTEGVTRGFPVLRSLGGEKLAQGELTQVARAGDLVESRLGFRFKDGSLYDERVTFSQKYVFTLISYHIVQQGP